MRRKIQLDDYNLLKDDRPHRRNYLHTPTDYRHTDKHLGLVDVPIALYCEKGDRWMDITKYIISLALLSINIH